MWFTEIPPILAPNGSDFANRKTFDGKQRKIVGSLKKRFPNELLDGDSKQIDLLV
jgi:hypothetical protein